MNRQNAKKGSPIAGGENKETKDVIKKLKIQAEMGKEEKIKKFVKKLKIKAKMRKDERIKVVFTKRSTKRMLNMRELNTKELNMKGKKFGENVLHMKQDQVERGEEEKIKEFIKKLKIKAKMGKDKKIKMVVKKRGAKRGEE